SDLHAQLMFLFRFRCEAQSPTRSPTQFLLVFITMPRVEVLPTGSKPTPKTIAARFSPRGFSGRLSRASVLRIEESGRPNITYSAIADCRPFLSSVVFLLIPSKPSWH